MPIALALALVIGITDGDTLIVLEGKQQVKVRLAEIDAPEKAQPFGTRSKQSLSELCFQKEATYREKDRDRWGRVVAYVTCDGVDANAEQLRRGMAWRYKYAPKRSPYHALELEACEAQRGLWVDQDPVAPWDWRAK